MAVDVAGALLSAGVGQLLAIAWGRHQRRVPATVSTALADAMRRTTGYPVSAKRLDALLSRSDLLERLGAGDEGAAAEFGEELLAVVTTWSVRPTDMSAAKRIALAASLASALVDAFDESLPVEDRLVAGVLRSQRELLAGQELAAADLAFLRETTGALHDLLLEHRRLLAEEDGADDELLLRAYLELAHSRLGRLPEWMRRPSRAGWTRERISQRVRLREGDHGHGRDLDPTMSWGDIRTRLGQMVVLGPPGIGKSWFAQEEFRAQVAETLRSLDEGEAVAEVSLPFFLPAPALLGIEEGEQPLAKMLAIALEPLTDEFGSQLTARLGEWLLTRVAARQPMTFVIDAFDEIPSPRMNEARLVIERVSPAGERRFLVTARQTGYTGCGLAGDVVTEVELLPFGEAEQRAFIDAWFTGDPDGRAAMESRLRSTRIGELARVPLLLAFICLLSDDATGLMPTTRTDVLAAAARRLVAKPWRRVNALEPGDPKIERRLELLASIAALMAESPTGWAEALPLPTLREHVAQVADEHDLWTTPRTDHPHDRAQAELDALGEILVSASDWRSTSSPTLKIAHRNLQEYCVALRLSKDLERATDILLAHWWVDPDWYELLPLIAGLAQNPALVDAVAADAPDSACLGTLAALRASAEISAPIGPLLRDRIVLLLSSPVPEIRREVAASAAFLPLDVDLASIVESDIESLIGLFEAGRLDAAAMIGRIARRAGDGRPARIAVAGLVARRHLDGVAEELRGVATDAHREDVRLAAARGVMDVSPDDGAAVLVSLTTSAIRAIRTAAVEELGDPRWHGTTLPLLRELVLSAPTRPGVRRRAAVILARNGDADGLHVLEEVARTSDLNTCLAAAQELLDIHREAGSAALTRILEGPYAIQYRTRAGALLVADGSNAAVGPLCAVVRSSVDELDQRAFVPLLAPLTEHAEVQEALSQLAIFPASRQTRRQAVRALLDHEPRAEAADALRVVMTGSKDSVITALAAGRLVAHGDASAIPILERLAQDAPHSQVRTLAVQLQDPRALTDVEIVQAARSKTKNERMTEVRRAIDRLAEGGHPSVVGWAALSVKAPHLREHAARGLARRAAEPEVQSILKGLAKDGDEPVRRIAASALTTSAPELALHVLCQLATEGSVRGKRAAMGDLLKHSPTTAAEFAVLLGLEPTPSLYRVWVLWLRAAWLPLRSDALRSEIRRLGEDWDAWHLAACHHGRGNVGDR